jgi:hypothetical protein
VESQPAGEHIVERAQPPDQLMLLEHQLLCHQVYI